MVRSPTNWHTPAYGVLARDGQAAEVLADDLLGRASRRLDLAFLAQDDPVAEAIRARAVTGRARTLERVVLRSPFIELEGDFDSFEAGLPRKRRYEMRRRRTRLEELGEVTVEHFDGSERLDELLAEGFTVEAAGWKGRRGTAISADKSTVRFYEDVARWAVGRGWLRLWFVRLDGRPIAFAYCLEHLGTFFTVKVGFDAGYAAYAPGTLLTRETIASSFAAGLRRYDFLGQAEPYKLIWTDRLVERTRLQAFGSTVAGTASWLGWSWVAPVVRSARERLRR